MTTNPHLTTALVRLHRHDLETDAAAARSAVRNRRSRLWPSPRRRGRGRAGPHLMLVAAASPITTAARSSNADRAA